MGTAISQPYLQAKIECINKMKQDVRNPDYRKNAFRNVLSEHYVRLRESQTSTRAYIAESLNALHSVLQEPDLVEPDLLVNYITEIIRFVENVGLGFDFGKIFIDRAINVYRDANYSLVDLYLAKANFLRLDTLENAEREATFLEARSEAERRHDMEGLVRVLFRLAEYYTEVSLYEKSLKACHECEQVIQREGGHLQQFLARVYTDLGMNYTTLFRYEQARYHFLQAKATLEADPTLLQAEFSIYPGKRTMATILHYLGRIAEAEGNALGAMYYYVEGNRYQSMCPEELSASAFYHLRLGELLTSANLLEQARYHIEASQSMFDAIQFSSSGRVLVGLAWGSIYDQEGNYTRAKEYITLACTEARIKHFPRGELLCSVKLFWLELKYRHIHYALYTLIQAIIIWYRGERQRAGLQLLKKYFLQVFVMPIKLLKRSPHMVTGAKMFNAQLTYCACPVHKQGVMN